METKVKTGKVRFSYAHVFEPAAPMNAGDKPKFGVVLLIQKTDKATIRNIAEAVQAAYVEGVQKHSLPKKLELCKTPLRDGDDEKPDDENYEGMMFLSANSYNKPGIIDAKGNELFENSEFYSGCWGRASINFYAYSTGSKGIACGLNSLMKLEDGERLSGGNSSPLEDFKDDLDLM